MDNICEMVHWVCTHFEKYTSRFCLSDSLVDCGSGGCDGPGKNSYVNVIDKLICWAEDALRW